MLNQINSEWIKLKSVRSNIILFIIAIAINVLLAFLIAIFKDSTTDADLLTLLPGQFFATLFFLVAGVQIIGQEYRFSTIRPTFSVTPNRLKVIAAKLFVLSATVGFSTISLAVLSGLIGELIFSIRGIDLVLQSSDYRTLGYLIVGNIICGLVGFGVGAIVRQPIAAIVIVLVWPIIIENIIVGIGFAISEHTSEIFQKWLPFQNYSRAIEDFTAPYLFSPLAGMVYFFAFSAVLVFLGSVLIKKRDA